MFRQLVILGLVITSTLFSQVPVPKSKEEQEWLERRQREMNEKSEKARNEALRLIQLGQAGLAEFKQDKEKYIYTGGTSGYEFISVLSESKEPVAKDMLLEIAIDTTLWDMVRGDAMRALGKKSLKYNELLKVINTVGLFANDTLLATQRTMLLNNYFALIRAQKKVAKDRKLLQHVIGITRVLIENRNFIHLNIIIDIIGGYPLIPANEKAKLILLIDSLCLAQDWRGLREKYVADMIPHIPLFLTLKFKLTPDAMSYLRTVKTSDRELNEIFWLVRGYLGDEGAIDTVISLALNSDNKLVRYHAINDVLGRDSLFNSRLIPVFEKALSDSHSEVRISAANTLRRNGINVKRMGKELDRYYIEKEER